MITTIRHLGLAAILLGALSLNVLATPPQTGIHGQAFRYISYGSFIFVGGDLWIGIPSIQLSVAASFTLLSVHNGREVARVTTDAQGVYTVWVPPGKYLLVPDTLVVNPFLNCTVST